MMKCLWISLVVFFGICGVSCREKEKEKPFKPDCPVKQLTPGEPEGCWSCAGSGQRTQLIIDRKDTPAWYGWVTENGEETTYFHPEQKIAAIFTTTDGEKAFQLTNPADVKLKHQLRFHYVGDEAFKSNLVISKPGAGYETLTCRRY